MKKKTCNCHGAGSVKKVELYYQFIRQCEISVKKYVLTVSTQQAEIDKVSLMFCKAKNRRI